MKYEAQPLVNNGLAQQFELKIDGVTSVIEYKLSGKRIFLMHTTVPKSLEGKGVGTAILEKALHYIDEHQLRLIPLCSATKDYIKVHPEWRRLFDKGIYI